MKKIEFDQRIIRGMQHLNALTQLDLVWFSPAFERVHSLAKQPIPQVLDFDPEEDNPRIAALCMETAPPSSCVASTRGDLEFVFIPLLFQDAPAGYLRMGPFLTSPKDDASISRLMVHWGLPLFQRHLLRNYYDSLKILSDNYSQHLSFIGMNLFGSSTHDVPTANYHALGGGPQAAEGAPAADATEDMLALRYGYEHELRRAVARGDETQVEKLIRQIETETPIKDRFPENPLRSAKNIAIVMNTIFRHAAEEGGLHPVYLDQLSMRFAILIEQASTRAGIYKLQTEMYQSYTRAVKEHAYPQLSPSLRRVVDTIQLHLDEDLGVTALARRFEMQPSNLANQFKAQMGCTLSEFVNRLRVQEACHHLRHTGLSVQEISRLVGIDDPNYFSRVFRKHKHLSPTGYRRASHAEEEGRGARKGRPQTV
ncbi:helix-turn-helix domain-containing protein [Anaerotalea alkaliphila]|uniref:Helix-turn-helix domain-containing protein n=1 Tax=Anaerotalea alkaliphila TaxID=2662126 RepID=A0A7X5HUM2_9FIRM|nr:AraC family transcriptional regulator [Anaerotalea alkaliphila]NDL66939.1 helix-turn-helix domain-containing protein [Anaerotalea alkaliphila]